MIGSPKLTKPALSLKKEPNVINKHKKLYWIICRDNNYHTIFSLFFCRYFIIQIFSTDPCILPLRFLTFVNYNLNLITGVLLCCIINVPIRKGGYENPQTVYKKVF